MESAIKRARINDSLWSEWVSSKPTSTILVFNIIPAFSATDICGVFQPMGTIKAVEIVPDGTVALIEFTDVMDVMRIVENTRSQSLCIGNQELFVEFCLHKLWHAHEATCLGSVLRVDIAQAIYPITVKTLQAVCQTVANPVRILIGPKTAGAFGDNTRSNYVCALLEVENNAQAAAVRDGLDDQAIYTGCCLLHVTFSALPTIPVRFNDNTLSWDYSRPYLGKGVATAKVGLLGNRPSGEQVEPAPFTTPPPNFPPPGFLNLSTSIATFTAPQTEPAIYAPADGTTLFINGLNMEKFNCDRLFNLVSIYGNVAKIKFLTKRPGVAMVQMSTPEQGRVLMDLINGLFIFGRQLHLVVSKDKSIKESREVLPPLADDTPSMKNYMNNHNNRFRPGNNQNKSRLIPPTATLHFFNAPTNITSDMLREACVENGSTAPDRIAVFPLKEDAKSSLGLMEWASVCEAAQALVFINNVVINETGSNQPYHIKVAFSSKPIMAIDPSRNGASRKRTAETEN